jgi:hypothetical protein
MPKSDDTIRMATAPIEAFRGSASAYYADAEQYFEAQWKETIWPLIKNMDFSITVDFAAGHGRNSERLATLAKQLYIVEPNPDAVTVLQRRFSSRDFTCSIQVVQNSGMDLQQIPSKSIGFLYSFDSVVHFERQLVQLYMPEFERILAPGGYAFVHHSNFGRISQEPDFRKHPGWRSNVDKDWFAQCAFRNRLLTIKQVLIPWQVSDVVIEEFDCITLLYKPAQWLAV